jgi:hypothetical protein
MPQVSARLQIRLNVAFGIVGANEQLTQTKLPTRRCLGLCMQRRDAASCLFLQYNGIYLAAPMRAIILAVSSAGSAERIARAMTMKLQTATAITPCQNPSTP